MTKTTTTPTASRNYRRELGIGRPSRYSSLAAAWNALDTTFVNPGRYTTVLGDDGKVWVVTAREASILFRAGFEQVNRRGEPRARS